MKGKILILILAALFVFPSFAQKQASGAKDKDSRRQEMLELKLDYLAKEIDLKEDQKKQFDELYTQMETERRAIFKKIKSAEKAIKNNKDATEADYEKASNEINSAKAEMSRIEKQYNEKFATFLSKKQLYKLNQAENTFMQKMQNCRDKKKHEKKK